MFKIFIALFAVLMFSCNSFSENQILAEALSNDAEATCTGSRNCSACKNCKYCKHCAKDGGSCGVCR